VYEEDHTQHTHTHADSCIHTHTQVHEEEWSYIPVGGPLPVGDQPITAFGAAANLVHPATGVEVFYKSVGASVGYA
jgi:hypothetical protein